MNGCKRSCTEGLVEGQGSERSRRQRVYVLNSGWKRSRAGGLADGQLTKRSRESLDRSTLLGGLSVEIKILEGPLNGRNCIGTCQISKLDLSLRYRAMVHREMSRSHGSEYTGWTTSGGPLKWRNCNGVFLESKLHLDFRL